jgi:putative ABC transport system permease protein
MIRHLLALTWNRRRTNVLLMFEIFVAFMVLVLLITWAVWGWITYRQPLGYSTRDVWKVDIRVDRAMAGVEQPPDPRLPERYRHLIAAVSALPAVVAVAAMDGGSPMTPGYRSSIAHRECWRGSASDDVPAVLGLELIRGRWFGKQDDGVAYQPVVITEPLARSHFGDANPLDQLLEDDHDRERGLPPLRVVGVARYRFSGEFDKGHDFLFHRLRLEAIKDRSTSILLKVRPGTPAAFEEALAGALHGVARDWSFLITAYDQRRQRMIDQLWTGIMVIAALAGFVFLMVALGLSGVVWQNVTQRTAEIGLRRAQGATAGDIQRQLLGELLAMATLPMAVGGLVVVNFAAVFADMPVFDLSHVHAGVYVAGFAISVLCIYVLVTVSGFLPTRLATRVQPFEALRYE